MQISVVSAISTCALQRRGTETFTVTDTSNIIIISLDEYAPCGVLALRYGRSSHRQSVPVSITRIPAVIMSWVRSRVQHARHPRAETAVWGSKVYGDIGHMAHVGVRMHHTVVEISVGWAIGIVVMRALYRRRIRV